MTFFDNTQRRTDVFGPYSPWPRKPVSRRSKARVAIFAATAAGAGVFAHCIAPMIV